MVDEASIHNLPKGALTKLSYQIVTVKKGAEFIDGTCQII